MNTSIKISNRVLTSFLQRIGKAIGEGKDLIIHESSHQSGLRYVYTEVLGDKKEILEMEGDLTISVNKEEGIGFSDAEIEMMETPKLCPDTEAWVDQYHCNFLCPSREGCAWK